MEEIDSLLPRNPLPVHVRLRSDQSFFRTDSASALTGLGRLFSMITAPCLVSNIASTAPRLVSRVIENLAARANLIALIQFCVGQFARIGHVFPSWVAILVICVIMEPFRVILGSFAVHDALTRIARYLVFLFQSVIFNNRRKR